MEELNKLSEQLLRLETNRDWQTGDETCKLIARIFGVEVERFKLWQDPRIVAEATRFMTAFETINNPASYGARHAGEKAVEIKLFWMKKTSKTNLSWVVGSADNFEDSITMQHKNIGIDLVIPESCDRVFVIVSNQYKLRVLELHSRLSLTDREILTSVIKGRDSEVSTFEEKISYHTIIWNAFNFEPINKRFYKELVDRFIVLRDHLAVQGNLTQPEAVSFSTRLIGRLLFIKFLDKKGLINSNVGYLNAPLGDSDVQTNYYREKLEVLFYKTLNTEIAERHSSDTVTPYLNGGLFDDSVSDFYNKNVVTFPDNYFNVFHEVLEKYNFTVDESSPEFQQVAVDPEMLGRIFESLLGEMQTKAGDSLRSATGAFYTPREIVSYMCEQSLLEYLKTKISDSPDRDRRLEEIINLSESIFRDQDQNKRRDWKPYKQPILDALETVTIFDPAVGSGAFPMGMLHLLIKVYTRLDSKYEKNLSKLKREILSRSLYGCDISTTAIEICRLRAWLSIIVDIPKGDNVESLPNLEFKFVCANTLIPLEKNIQQTLDPKSDSNLKKQLIDIRDEYFKTGSKKSKEILRKSYNKLTQPSLFGETKTEKQLKSYKPFDISSSSEFYDPELMHGVESFNIVIGNPPYVGEKGNKETFRPIAESSLGKRFYQGKMDLFYFFFHIALDYLREGGVMAYITTNYYITATGGIKLRNDMKERSTVLKLLNFGELKIFESALGQHNMITMLTKGKRSAEVNVLLNNKKGYLGVDIINSIINGTDLGTNYYKMSQDELYDGTESYIRLNGGSVLSKDPLQIILENIKKQGELLDVICNVNNGVFAGTDNLSLNKKNKYNINNANEGDGIFVLKNEEVKNLKLTQDELRLIKPLYKNSDIKRYYTNSDNELNLINLRYTDRPKIANFPNIQKHLNKFKDLLSDRPRTGTLESAFNNGYWYVMSTSRKVDMEAPKIVAPQRSKTNTFGYNEISWYASADVYFITEKDKSIRLKYILALLNSALYYLWLYYRGKRKGETLELYGNPLSEIPIKKISESEQKPFIDLIDQILTIKKENKDADTKNLELQIDQLVYKLYDLTPEEIEIIKNYTKK